jgi:hypothetical protein
MKVEKKSELIGKGGFYRRPVTMPHLTEKYLAVLFYQCKRPQKTTIIFYLLSAYAKAWIMGCLWMQVTRGPDRDTGQIPPSP